MSELPCPYCGSNCEIPSNVEEKIDCPNCGRIFLYLQHSESHGTVDYRPSSEINDGCRQISELKAFNMPRYAGEFTIYKVYLKSEADKVIAERDAEIRRLKRALWIAHEYKAKFKRWWLHLALDCEASMIRPDTKTINRIKGKIGNCEKSERKCRDKAEDLK